MSIDYSQPNTNSGYQFGSGSRFGSHSVFGNQHVHAQHIGDRYELDVDPTAALFTGRGPGRVLMVLGLCVVAFSFTGWASIIFAGATGSPGSNTPLNLLGPPLASGIPVGIVYFLGLPFGGLLLAIGGSMAKAATRGGRPIAHLIASVVAVAIGVVAVLTVSGGRLPDLMPSLSGHAGRASGPPVVVSDRQTSANRGGLTLTVVKVENTAGHGVVHLQAWNNTDETITLPTRWFVLTDGAGHTYEPTKSGSDWSDELGAKARRTGSVTLTTPVALGTGNLRVEFTTVLSHGGPGAIAVTDIPSH